MYSSKINSSYFLNKELIILNNFSFLLQISTPRLEPSLIGFATIGKLIFFVLIILKILFF